MIAVATPMAIEAYTSSYNTVLRNCSPHEYTFVRTSASYPEWFDTYCPTLEDISDIVAPPWWLIRRFKKDGDWDSYVADYNAEVLSRLPQEVLFHRLEEIYERNECKPLVLLCWCNGKCHRVLVAKHSGIEMKELL